METVVRDQSAGIQYQGVCVANDQRKFWAGINCRGISWKSGPAVLASLRDITETVLWGKVIEKEAEDLRKQYTKLKSTIKDRYRLGDLIGKSAPMQEVYELILKAATTNANVVVYGESGTGKELVARSIHHLSNRSSKPIVPVNCAAIPEGLIESEFFGHRKGAFTGAHLDKKGYFYCAGSGTLFLDEVGEIGLNMQAKLLRAIETGEFTPVGDTRVQKADACIISATHRNLSDMAKMGQMREDFFYRIAVIPITVPPLREHKEDIPLLVDHYLKLYGKGKNLVSVPGRIMDALLEYQWPGNIRELQNVLQRYLVVGELDSIITHDGMFGDEEDVAKGSDPSMRDLNTALVRFEKELILNALKENNWNKTKAASVLGIDRRSLLRKMQRVGII